MSKASLVSRLRPADFLELTAGHIEEFEDAVGVDFEYWFRRLTKLTVKLDEAGNVVVDEEGSPIYVPDPEALNSPNPVPKRWLGLRMLVWFANRDRIADLTPDDLKAVQLGDLAKLVNAPGAPAEADDDPFDGSRKPLVLEAAASGGEESSSS